MFTSQFCRFPIPSARDGTVRGHDPPDSGRRPLTYVMAPFLRSPRMLWKPERFFFA
jgi:hypothetical protein